MTRDDIIRMAREAGVSESELFPGEQAIERFAALVAGAEREAIAQMIEDAPALVKFATNEHGGCLVCGFTPKLAASAIRARGETK